MTREALIDAAFRSWTEDEDDYIEAKGPEDLKDDPGWNDYLEDLLEFANDSNIEDPEEAVSAYNAFLIENMHLEDPASIHTMSKAMGYTVQELCRCGARVDLDKNIADLVLDDGFITVAHMDCMLEREKKRIGLNQQECPIHDHEDEK